MRIFCRRLRINKMKKILITGGGTGTAFSYVTHIKKNWGDNVEIHVCDINESKYITSALFSDYAHKVPYANDENYKIAIANIINQNNIDLVIPLLNAEVLQISRAREEGLINKHVSFMFSLDIAAKICNDKKYAGDIMESVGIPVPKTWLNFSDLPSVLFCKPKDGFGSINAKLIHKDEIKDEILDNAYIYQELLVKPEVTVDCFYDDKKDYIYVSCRERIEIKNGVCTKARLFKDNDLEKIALNIARKIQVRGGFCFQVMKALNTNQWKVIDLNMRLGAGTAISYAGGSDFFSATYALFLNEDYKQYLSNRKSGIVTRQYVEFLSHE